MVSLYSLSIVIHNRWMLYEFHPKEVTGIRYIYWNIVLHVFNLFWNIKSEDILGICSKCIVMLKLLYVKFGVGNVLIFPSYH